jgi:hypothetical protein
LIWLIPQKTAASHTATSFLATRQVLPPNETAVSNQIEEDASPFSRRPMWPRKALQRNKSTVCCLLQLQHLWDWSSSYTSLHRSYRSCWGVGSTKVFRDPDNEDKGIIYIVQDGALGRIWAIEDSLQPWKR